MAALVFQRRILGMVHVSYVECMPKFSPVPNRCCGERKDLPERACTKYAPNLKRLSTFPKQCSPSQHEYPESSWG